MIGFPFRLATPLALLALGVLIPIAWTWWRESRWPVATLFGDAGLLADLPRGMRVRLRWLPRALRILFFLLAALALARPQAGTSSEKITTLGVDLVVALDRSGSMRALDFTPDRLGAAKETLREFAEGRPTDRIGLVTFAREAYTACPLTIDHEALLAVADDIPFARREEDGTAIGLGLGAAVSRLQASEATSRVIVLVTDGVNNSGSISPLTAAELARESAIKVYTIGVGTRGLARMPRITPSGRTVIRPEPVEIDEETLRSIAEMTGGSYFRADNDGALDEIFGEIDALEKSDIESDLYVSWEDRFAPLLIAAALVLLLEVGVARFLFWRVP